MMVYISTLVRSIIAFHDLIENKLDNKKLNEKSNNQLDDDKSNNEANNKEEIST